MTTTTERPRLAGVAFRPTPTTRGKTVFTTGHVARLCKVAPRTVSKWVDAGRIPGAYRIPGSQDRRIPRKDLIQFLKDHHMPLGELETDEECRVLTVAVSATITGCLDEHLAEADGYRRRHEGSTWEAGLGYVGFNPDVVVIDMSVGRYTAVGFAAKVREMAGAGDCPLLVAITGADDGDPQSLVRDGGFDAVFIDGFDARDLCDRIALSREG